MSTERIPEKVIVTCDICRTKCDMSIRLQRKCEGQLILKAHGLDQLGDVACDGTRTLDLCDRCLDHVRKAIDALRDSYGSASSV